MLLRFLKQSFHAGFLLNSDSLLLSGSLLLAIPFCILIISSVLFIFGYPISSFQAIVSIVIGICFLGWGCRGLFKDKKLRAFLSILLCTSLLVILSICFSGMFYDVSWDGQSYHKEAIIQLAKGWNIFSLVPLNAHPKPIINTQINSFSKGPWIYAAALYKTTGLLETSKAFNLLFIIASFFISLSALLKLDRLKPKFALAISFLFSFNPIAICQSLSFYIDGQLYSLLLALLSFFYLFLKRGDKFSAIMLIINLILLINVKLTAPIYAFISMLGALFFSLVYKKTNASLRLLQIFAISFSLGIFLAGCNPYVTNTLKHKNPFYPASGTGKLELMKEQMPNNFYGMSRLGKLWLSLFSKAGNFFTPLSSSLKIPFTFSKDELDTFSIPDTRISGFGILFSGAILLTMLIILSAFILELKRVKVFLTIILLIIFSVLLNPEAWWARFVPQLWMVPVFALSASFFTKSKLIRRAGYLLLFVLFFNILLVLMSYMYNTLLSNTILVKQLRYLALKSKTENVYINFHDFKSSRVWFEELGVKYKEVEKMPCAGYLEEAEKASSIEICTDK